MTNLLDKLKGLELDNKKMLLIALVCLLVLYLDFSFIIKLQLGGIKSSTPKITKLKKDINALAKDLSWMQDLERRQGKDKAKAAPNKGREIISEDKILVLLQEIADMSNNYNIKLTQINTSKDAKVQEEVIAGERLLPVIITLDLNCGYQSLSGFMRALENARFFIDVQDMKIVRDPHNYLLENVNLILKAYARK